MNCRVKNGLTKSLGSLLTLMKDSEKKVIVKWSKSQDKASMDMLKKEIFNMELDSIIEHSDTNMFVQKLEDFSILDVSENKNYISINGTYNSVYDLIGNNYKDITPYLFRAYLFKKKKINYFVFTSMVAYKDFWNIEFDLIPTGKEFNSFVNNDIAPDISVLNEILK